MDDKINGRKKRWRRWAMALMLIAIVLIVSGCQTLSFYAQAIKGQYQIYRSEQPIDTLLASPETPPDLKEHLRLVQRLRSFAETDLKLHADRQYLKYADLHRRFVVWNVEASPEFSMEAKTWWYPLVGSLKYRGYFTRAGATNYAAALRRHGYDVFVGGVEAYSTLGWLKDPVLNTFIYNPDLPETIFHELAHERVFARGDTDFNEAFATTVGEEGERRWLRASGDQAAYEAYLTSLAHNADYVRIVSVARRKLETLYGDEREEDGKIKATRKNRDVPPEQLRAGKEKILDELRQDYQKLKQSWTNDNSYDPWFTGGINNAQLNSVATYYDLVPGFEQVLQLNGGNLEKFYQEAERLAHLSRKERHEWLLRLGRKQTPLGGSVGVGKVISNQ